MRKKYHLLTLIILFFTVNLSFAQPIKPNALLKKTEQSLKNINTLTYKIHRIDKHFTSKDTLKRSAVGTIKIVPEDEIEAYHILNIKSTNSKYSYHKYDGIYTSSLFYSTDLINNKKISIENVKENNYNSIKGTFISSYLLQDYFKKQNVFKQYRSLLAKILIKDITTEESIYKDTPVYVLTVYGKDKPRPNRINSSIDKYYIRKSDFLPIAHSFYGEFEGMKETEFTEIEYLEINPELSLDAFKINPAVKEVKPRVYYEEMQKYNL